MRLILILIGSLSRPLGLASSAFNSRFLPLLLIDFYSIGLLGLLGGILPVHGLNTYMFLASVTITYTFNKNRKAQEENNL